MSADKKKITPKISVLDQWRNRNKSSVTTSEIPIKPVDAKNLPSSGQQRLWLLQQLYPNNHFYQYSHLYKIKGALDITRLRESFQQVLNKQEILRSNFVKSPEGVEVIIGENKPFSIEEYDLSSTTLTERESTAFNLIKKLSTKTFDLAKDLLIRAQVIKLNVGEYWLLLSIHHIIGDRSSLLILQKEIASFYNQRATLVSDTNKTEPLPIQYTDYAHWERKQKNTQAHLDYWVDQLSGSLPILDLPLDTPRPKKPSFNGAIFRKKLSSELSESIQEIAKKNRTTKFVVLLAVFKILLYRYAGQKDILVGSPFSNRDQVALENLIGFFNETLVLRSEIVPTDSFEEFIQKVKATTTEAMEHKQVPFDELVRKLQPERQGSANPLFQAMFVYNNSDATFTLGDDLEVAEEMVDIGVSKFDLTLFATDHGNTLELTFEYATDLFEEISIKRLLAHFETLLSSGITSPQTAISELAILDKKERQHILETWNDTAISIRPYTSIHQLIEEQVSKVPNQIAVVYEGTSITYAQLNEQAEAIAQTLVDAQIPVDSPVGLYVQRSVSMIVGILGVLKAGAAYLPLDPEYPEERINFILQDANVPVVLCQEDLQNKLAKHSINVITIESAITESRKKEYQKITSKKDLAYIIYTSGSTGKPKGVPITHQNLIHSTTARFHFFKQQPEAFLLLSSFAFDSSVAGIFWTLCSGGKLVIPPKRIEQNIDKLGQIIYKEKITHTLLLPSLYQLLLEYSSLEKIQTLQTVMVAGEACSAKVLNTHFEKIPSVELVNEYGPTEGTVWCTAHTIKPEDAQGIVPIGRPIPNVTNYILDNHLQPVPIGVVGELYIGGKGIAKGYLDRPELTKERFLKLPFLTSEEGYVYKTGDLARYKKDGTIDFLGRADHQLKIRGHRIEPDEIRVVLSRMKGVQEALVRVQKNNEIPYLVAYLLTDNPQETINIRNSLKEVFPDYMIPAVFMQLEEFPRLPNGKVALEKLPVPQAEAVLNEKTFVAPSTEIEQQLTTIWEAILKISPIGIHDNFFEIGGDSIQSIQVIAKASKAGIALAPDQLFEHQTIGSLANYLASKKANADLHTAEWSSIVSLNKNGSNKNGSKPPLFCIHSGGGHVFFYQPLAKRLSSDQPLFALQPSGLDGQNILHSSIEEMARFYIQEMKKVQATGPYHILGTCFSNAVGLEIANQLQANGDTVAILIIVDSGPQYLLGASFRGEKKTMSRFASMIKDGNWSGIHKKFRNRFIRSKQKITHSFKSEQEQHLQLTINNLNELYHQYTWKPFDGKITFIRSTEFANRADKNNHITQWNQLAKKGLEVHVTEGHHLTLFKEPEVAGLTEIITTCLQKAQEEENLIKV